MSDNRQQEEQPLSHAMVTELSGYVRKTGRETQRRFDAGATIKVLDFPSLDLTRPEGRGFLAMFSAMAERERLRIVARTRAGRRFARTNGVKMGPPFKLSEHQRKLAAKQIAAGESTRQIARDFNVSHNTIARLR